MSLTALSLAACNQEGQTSKSSKSKKSGAQESYEVVELSDCFIISREFDSAAAPVWHKYHSFLKLTKQRDL